MFNIETWCISEGSTFFRHYVLCSTVLNSRAAVCSLVFHGQTWQGHWSWSLHQRHVMERRLLRTLWPHQLPLPLRWPLAENRCCVQWKHSSLTCGILIWGMRWKRRSVLPEVRLLLTWIFHTYTPIKKVDDWQKTNNTCLLNKCRYFINLESADRSSTDRSVWFYNVCISIHYFSVQFCISQLGKEWRLYPTCSLQTFCADSERLYYYNVYEPSCNKADFWTFFPPASLCVSSTEGHRRCLFVPGRLGPAALADMSPEAVHL